MTSFLDFFTDPVLMAPTIGSMLMCFLGAIVGSFAVLKRYALVGEMLSHACYPGVLAALLLFQDAPMWTLVVFSATSCGIAMMLAHSMQHRFKVSSDASLCFILASFFGIGLTIISMIQNEKPALYKQMQSYLFGQAATMTHTHMWAYMIATGIVLVFVFAFYRLLKVFIFDALFGKISGFNIFFAHLLLQTLIVFAVVIGIRSVGVVLMSSMLIFPCVIARFWTHKMAKLLVVAGITGLLTGFLGVWLSHTLSIALATSFPTGPTIVFVAGFCFFLSSLFSQEKGVVCRLYRRIRFLIRCKKENILKTIWKITEKEKVKSVTRRMLQSKLRESGLLVTFCLWQLTRNGRLRTVHAHSFMLTASGALWARKIVRFHRLWEVYLVEYCGVAKDRVHPSAEEMEHIITPEIERELECMLLSPKEDPHHQPIPVQEPIQKEFR